MLPNLGRLAERAGVAGVCVADHVVLGGDVAGYPYGEFQYEPSAPFMEPLSFLGAVGAVTSRITLATHVLLPALRRATVLAKTIATVDRLTQGRLELGVGVGWHRAEFESGGLCFEERGRLLDETIAGCRALWRSSPASFQSRSVRFEQLWCEPKPMRPAGPPVLFSGAMSSRNVRRIIEMGDGWIAPGVTTVAEVANGVARLRSACASGDRDAATMKVRASLPVVRDDHGAEQLIPTLAQAADFAAAGATDVVLTMAAFVRQGDDLEAWFARLGSAWHELCERDSNASR
jgi:probable F420-dependent oxidoreductase